MNGDDNTANTGDREQMIQQIMRDGNFTRPEAEFVCAIELGEIDGDTVVLPPDQPIDEVE